MILELAAFAQHAASCAPNVHVETLAALARTESGFNMLAIGDNSVRRAYSPKSKPEAIRIATDLIKRQGHSVDLGLMQINSLNLPRLGMSIADAFEPCSAMKAAARVLHDGYKPPPAGHDVQPALIRAISHYNTGNPERGVSNGYVGKVLASAKVVVPALRTGAPMQAGSSPRATGPAAPFQPEPAETQAPPPPVASWDVYGRARAALVGQPVQELAPAGDAPASPIQLRLVTSETDLVAKPNQQSFGLALSND